MAHPRRPFARFVRSLFSCLAMISATCWGAAHAAPVAGFVEQWTGTSVSSWSGGSTLSNPGAGGVLGAGDGYLDVSTSFAGQLGTVSFGVEYGGDWVAAMITGVSFSLDDVGADEALEIHFSIGNAGNFWQYDVPMSPPGNAWQSYDVDLTSDSNWTRIKGDGTFQGALQSVDRIHFRHDLAPYLGTPDLMAGGFGVDQLTLRGPLTPTRSTTWGRIKALYR